MKLFHLPILFVDKKFLSTFFNSSNRFYSLKMTNFHLLFCGEKFSFKFVFWIYGILTFKKAEFQTISDIFYAKNTIVKNECKESFKSCKIPPKGLTSLETLSLFMRHFFSYSCQNNQLQFDTQSIHDDPPPSSEVFRKFIEFGTGNAPLRPAFIKFKSARVEMGFCPASILYMYLWVKCLIDMSGFIAASYIDNKI